MIDGSSFGRWGNGVMERKNELVNSSVNRREFLMAFPDGVFGRVRLRGFVSVENVGKGFGVRGGIGNVEVNSQSAGLVVRAIHDVVAR